MGLSCQKVRTRGLAVALFFLLNSSIGGANDGCIVRTVVGRPISFSGDGGPATAALLFTPGDAAVDSTGNIYVADTSNHRIRMISPAGVITTIAGTGVAGFNGDGLAPESTQLNFPTRLALGRQGDLYFSDQANHRVRKIAGGAVQTVAGNGEEGFAGDGGAAVTARLANPFGLAFDPAGNLYIADWSNHRIRMVAADGRIRTIAGNGRLEYPLFSGDGGPATQAQLFQPSGVAVDVAGNIYIADTSNHRIRRVTPSGVIETFAGAGGAGFSGDNGPAVLARLSSPSDLHIGPGGVLFVSDLGNARIRRITSDGTMITTVAVVEMLRGIGADEAGNLYAGSEDRLVKVTAAGEVSVLAGTLTAGFSGDGGPATEARLSSPAAVAVAANGDLYINDQGNNRIRKLSRGILTTVAGNGTFGFSGDGGPALSAQFSSPVGLAVDRAGALLIADSFNRRVRKLSGDVITTVVGGGDSTYGDNGPVERAQLNRPTRVAVDRPGNLVIYDNRNDGFPRRVTVADGIIRPWPLSQPRAFAFDPADNFFAVLPDLSGSARGDRMVRIAPDGSSTTLPASGFLFGVGSLAAAASGNLYVADSLTRILKLTPEGAVRIIAGGSGRGFEGEGLPAAQARFAGISGLALDADGNLYVADRGNHRIRVIEQAEACPAPIGPLAAIGGVVNAASFWAGPVAPGQIISLFGDRLGPQQGAGGFLLPNGRLSTEVANVRVLFEGVAAPLLYVSTRQINLVVPYSVASKLRVRMEIEANGVKSDPYLLGVAASGPGVFTMDSSGRGQAAALNEDGSLNSSRNPAKKGSVIMIFGTGEGQTEPGGEDGMLAAVPLPKPVLPVTVKIGGADAEVLYAGPAPGFAGLMQVNARIPTNAAAYAELVVWVGTARSQQLVTVAIQ